MDPNNKPYGFVDRLYEQGLFHGRTEVTNLGIGGLKTDGLNHYVKAVLDERAITAEERAGAKRHRSAHEADGS